MINFEMPPSYKIVATMEGEGVEQLQPTALDSEETTTTGTCAEGCITCKRTHNIMCTCDCTLIMYVYI